MTTDLKFETWSLNSLNWTPAANDSLSLSHLEQMVQQQMHAILEVDDDTYTRELTTYYLLGIAGMSVCSFGLVGNVLSWIVMLDKKLRASIYSYLSALAASDSLLLLASVVLLGKDTVKPVKGDPMWPWDYGLCSYLFPYVQPAATFFHMTSVWLTVAFTVDRYLMICHPFRAKRLCNTRNARKVIGGVVGCSGLFTLPRFFEFRTVVVPLPLTNETRLGCDLTTVGRSVLFREVYHSWLNLVFVFGLPFLLLVVLNSCLMRTVVRARRKAGRLTLNVTDRRVYDTTVMLVAVVLVFLVCQLPALVTRTIWALSSDPEHTFRRIPLYVTNEISSFLIVFNASANLMLYYFFGARFRGVFWQKFCCCFLRYERFRRHYRSPSLSSNVTAGFFRRNSCGNVTTSRRNSHSVSGIRHSKRRKSYPWVPSAVCGTSQDVNIELHAPVPRRQRSASFDVDVNIHQLL